MAKNDIVIIDHIIKEEMNNIISKDLPITKLTIDRLEAKKYYNDIVCPFCKTSAIIENNGIKLNIINCLFNNNFKFIILFYLK